MAPYFGNRSLLYHALGRRPTRRRSFNGMRLIFGLVIAAVSLYSYFGSSEFNPVTGETQYLSLTPRQEIALGLEAVPRMLGEYGGPHPDRNAQRRVDEIGRNLVKNSSARETKWAYEFHLLNDPRTVNAFALPGGQIFITYALYEKLKTDAQLAGVLGHEIGHVAARHSAQQIAKSQLTQGLTGAAVVASGDDGVGYAALLIGQLVNMKYGRGDELQSDALGLKIMSEAGYDPRAMIQVMKVLSEASGADGGRPEFFSTHPNPDNRIARIEEIIEELFPDGVPPGLEP